MPGWRRAVRTMLDEWCRRGLVMDGAATASNPVAVTFGGARSGVPTTPQTGKSRGPSPRTAPLSAMAGRRATPSFAVKTIAAASLLIESLTS